VDLKPQRAVNYEIGFKGLIASKLQYEMVIFNIQTTNEILSFEIENSDRDFFRNAGKTIRNGFETVLKYSPQKLWLITGNYTFSDFRFKEYVIDDTVFDGEKLPGIPMHSGSISIQYISPEGLFLKLIGQQVGGLFADDSNELEVKNYSVVNLNVGYEIESKKMKWTLFFGVNNLLHSKYNDNIRINAFGGRYYEPAPGINFFGGLRMKI